MFSLEHQWIAPDSLRVNKEQCSLILSSLPVGSAPGCSGWTYHIIRGLATGHDGVATFLDSACLLINSMLNGELLPDFWCAARSVFIPKKDGSYRPLGIGEAWYRAAGRVAMSLVGPSVAKDLLPYQLGIGIKGGCEIGARLAQVAMDSRIDMCGILLDFKNAFNCMPRQRIFRELWNNFPGLVRWFDWAYGLETDLYLSDGRLVGKCQTGIRQGDPLAGLCFCLGLQPALKEIKNMIDNVISRDRLSDECEAVLIAYLDDTNVFVPSTKANEVASKILDICNRHGISLQRQKCKFLLNAEADSSIISADPIFPVINTSSLECGHIILGTPVGSVEYRRRTAQELVDKMVKALKHLGNLEPRHATHLLRTCINTRASYLSRVLDLEHSFMALKSFDNEIDKAVLVIAGCVPTSEWTSLDTRNPIFNDVLLLRSLPTFLAGLGIPRHASPIGERAFLLSRRFLRDFLVNYYPHLTDLENPDYSICKRNDLTDYQILPALDTVSPERCEDQDLEFNSEMEKCTYKELAAALKKSVRSYQYRVSDIFLESLLENGRKAEAAWVRSSRFEGSGQWLRCDPYRSFGLYSISNKVFREALRLRLLLHPCDDLAYVDRQCTCTQEAMKEPFHLIDCKHSNWYHHNRHDAVQKILVELIKKVYAMDNLEIEEANVRLLTLAGNKAMGDIRFRTGASSRIIDVTVADPSAKSWREGAALAPDFCAEDREKAKTNQYRQVADFNLNNFVPFAVEATGRLGPRASRFLDELVGNNESLKWLFKDKINFAINFYNAKCVEQRKSQFRPVGGPYGVRTFLAGQGGSLHRRAANY